MAYWTGPRPQCRTPIGERLARRTAIDTATGCHNWLGNLNGGGYGVIIEGGLGSRLLRTHRVAYEIAKGPIPDGLQIDHLCRNRRCCNPDHLEAVTQQINMERGMAQSARNSRKTHCVRGHEFTPDNIFWRATGARQCRICRREAHKIAMRAKRAALKAPPISAPVRESEVV